MARNTLILKSISSSILWWGQIHHSKPRKAESGHDSDTRIDVCHRTVIPVPVELHKDSSTLWASRHGSQMSEWVSGKKVCVLVIETTSCNRRSFLSIFFRYFSSPLKFFVSVISVLWYSLLARVSFYCTQQEFEIVLKIFWVFCWCSFGRFQNLFHVGFPQYPVCLFFHVTRWLDLFQVLICQMFWETEGTLLSVENGIIW